MDKTLNLGLYKSKKKEEDGIKRKNTKIKGTGLNTMNK